MNAIEMKNVSLALDGFNMNELNIEVPKGHLTAVIGRNGAGKTTLFKLMHGVYPHFKGDIKVLGLTYKDHEDEIRENLSVMYDSMFLNPKHSPIKLLNLIKTMDPKFNLALFNQMVSDLDLDLNKPLKLQSLGMKRKLDFALTLSSNKDLILLDEPFNGIDPVYKKKIIHYIQSYLEDESKTVMISSHHVLDLEKIADYIMIIDNGKLLAFNDKESMMENAQNRKSNLALSLEDVFVEMVGNQNA